MASTVPSASIWVPTATGDFSPSEYAVFELVLICRRKPSRSLMVMIPLPTAVTVPPRCGRAQAASAGYPLSAG